MPALGGIDMENSSKREALRALKFTLFSISAGILEVVSFTVLNLFISWPEDAFSLMNSLLTRIGVTDLKDYGPNYFIALALSVVWNFTINRKFTFKSAANVPAAMLKVLLYYAVFTPLSIWWGVVLTNRCGWNEYLVLGLTMLANFVTEFLYQRFFVFGKSIDTADAAKAQTKDCAHPKP